MLGTFGEACFTTLPTSKSMRCSGRETEIPGVSIAIHFLSLGPTAKNISSVHAS